MTTNLTTADSRDIEIYKVIRITKIGNSNKEIFLIYGFNTKQ